MNITATFLGILNEETGTSKTGNTWNKANFKITYMSGKFPKEVIPSAWGSDIAVLKQLPKGTEITAGVEFSSREYAGKYYHDIKLFNIKGNNVAQGTNAPVSSDWRNDPDFADATDASDSLPF